MQASGPIDSAGTDDRDVLQALAPDQAVVPMGVAEVLVHVGGIRLGRVVPRLPAIRARARGPPTRDRGALTELERHFALEMNGETTIAPRRNTHYAAPRRAGRFDGPIDRGRINGL